MIVKFSIDFFHLYLEFKTEQGSTSTELKLWLNDAIISVSL